MPRLRSWSTTTVMHVWPFPWPVSSTPIDVRPSNSDGIPALGRPDPAERCRPRRAMRYAGDHSRSSGSPPISHAHSASKSRDAGKHRLAPQELFYDDIVSGDFPYARAIILTATVIGTSPCKKRRERTRAKVSIAAEVFNGLGTATHVVESAKSDIVIFMGQTMWSLGLGHQRMHDGEETSRHIPSSLINDSILSTHVHRGGTAVSAIIGLRWK